MLNDLVFEALRFVYRGATRRPAIDRATAQLPGGSAVAIIGPNGAGKSTLCKLLNGVLKPKSGTIKVGDRAVLPSLKPGKYVAYAFQNPDDQLFLPTVRKELSFGPRNLGMSHSEIEKIVSEIIRLFAIESVAESHPLELPLVLRKRVSMAAAAAMNRPWLILDEPTLGQEPRYRDRIVCIKNALLERGTSVMIITHDPEFAFETCNWFLLMMGGKCIWSGPREAFLPAQAQLLYPFINIPGRLSLALRFSPPCSTRTEVIERLRARRP